MQFSVKISDTNNPFYVAAKRHGQMMGIALPHLLAYEQPTLFKIVHGSAGSVWLEDRQGKSYKTHYGNSNRYNVASSYMKGYGRSVNKIDMENNIISFDYHLFASNNNEKVDCHIISSKDVLKTMEEDGSIFIE